MKPKDHDLSAPGINAVELNAEDLVCLSRPQAIERSQLHAEICASALGSNESSTEESLAASHRASSSMMQRLSGASVGIVGVVIVASIGMGAHFAGAKYNAEVVPAPATVAWTPIPERPQVVEPEPEVVVEAPPVRFANPFDKTEVFEFPPGTTKEEARELVAQMLLERARGRVSRR
jgi:hypothetical protein